MEKDFDDFMRFVSEDEQVAQLLDKAIFTLERDFESATDIDAKLRLSRKMALRETLVLIEAYHKWSRGYSIGP